jgi:hypothetical protein
MRPIHVWCSRTPAGVRCAHFFYCNHNIRGLGLKCKKSLALLDALIIHCVARVVAEPDILLMCTLCFLLKNWRRHHFIIHYEEKVGEKLQFFCPIWSLHSHLLTTGAASLLRGTGGRAILFSSQYDIYGSMMPDLYPNP